MIEHARKALAGDIGTTNIRFAVCDVDELTVDHFASLSTREFDRPIDALRQYLRSIPECPSMVSIAVAGDVDERGARMRNLPWRLAREDVEAVTGSRHVRLVARVEALVLVLPHLTDYDLLEVKPGAASVGGTRAMIAPGTGLEMGALIRAGDAWHPVTGQGGQAALCGVDSAEAELLGLLQSDLDYLPAEHVLSGPGLSAIHQVLSARAGRQPEALSAPQIVKQWHEEDDPVASAALDAFVKWLGGFAGNAVLAFGATGGLYIAGGIAPHIAGLLSGASFRTAFEARGRMTGYMASIPVSVVKPGADAGLRGATVALTRSLAEAGIA